MIGFNISLSVITAFSHMSSYPQFKNLNVTTDGHTVVWVVLVCVQCVWSEESSYRLTEWFPCVSDKSFSFACWWSALVKSVVSQCKGYRLVCKENMNLQTLFLITCVYNHQLFCAFLFFTIAGKSECNYCTRGNTLDSSGNGHKCEMWNQSSFWRLTFLKWYIKQT